MRNPGACGAVPSKSRIKLDLDRRLGLGPIVPLLELFVGSLIKVNLLHAKEIFRCLLSRARYW